MPTAGRAAADQAPTFAAALRFWAKLGFINFGGPTGQIAIMHEELVERRRWIGESRFLHALNFCMLLPGPEATQLAIYVGWLLHRAAGGIVAGALFVIPSVVFLWGLSWVYVTYGSVPWVAAVFYGLKPAVTAIVAAAVIRIGRSALRTAAMWIVAGAAFVAIFFLELPFPFIIGAAALLGFAGGRFLPGQFLVVRGHRLPPGASRAAANDPPESTPPMPPAAVLGDLQAPPAHAAPTWRRAAIVCGLGLPLWWLPVVLAGAWQGWEGTLFREGVFFSKAAMVTFGGAYAVLPYVAQKAVEDHEWLTPTQMLDGLGLAETTPGPLIMVVQFVGFLGGWNHPGDLPPLAAATLGALLTTWVTFVPCFLWIFLGAPHIERLRGNDSLSTTLSAITAAVVGVVLNLAVWFGLHVFVPGPRGLDLFAVAVAAVAFLAIARLRWSIPVVVLGGALAGLAYEVVSRV